MKLSAILPVLLILLFFIAGCDRNDLSDDPWLEMYGTYTGTCEIYVPGNTGAQDDTLSDWILIDKVHPDTVCIMPGECSGSMAGASGCIRILWKSNCMPAGECHEFHLNLVSHLEMTFAYKSNRMVLFIPRGEIYPGSDYRISGGPANQVTGLEFFEGNGLYMFDLEVIPSAAEPYLLMLFTGRKIPESMDFSGYTCRGNDFFSGEKHYPANITP